METIKQLISEGKTDEAACAEIKLGTYNYFKDIEKDNLCRCSLLK